MFATIRDYVNHQVANSTDISLNDFANDLNKHFNDNQDLTFKEELFELAKEENKGNFMISHKKLNDCGVATSDRSNDLVKRLKSLGLSEGKDFILRLESQNSKSRGQPEKVYMLTPRAFKLALLRAQKRKDQPIDPLQYALYYLFLEEVVLYYSIYQNMLKDMKNAMLTEEKGKLTEEKGSLEDTLSKLMSKVDKIVDSNERLEEEAKNAKFNLDKVSKSLNSKLDTVVTMLQEKSVVSTMNPNNPKLHHNFVCMGYKFTDEDQQQGRKLSFIAGQEVNVRKAMRKKFDDEGHDWTVQVGMHYNANPIDLRNNIQSRISKYLKEVIAYVNLKRSTNTDRQNARLKKEIKAYNKLNPDKKRSFTKEKKSYVKLERRDIPISCNRTSASYIDNDYVSYDDLIEVIRGVNTETQKSPYQSETSDTDASLG